jgi:hypothetical protein
MQLSILHRGTGGLRRRKRELIPAPRQRNDRKGKGCNHRLGRPLQSIVALPDGFALAVLVQVSGINALIDYAPRILQTAGWQMDAALFSTFGLGIVNVVFTLVSVYTVDHSGRKPLYLTGSIGMTIALALLKAQAVLFRRIGGRMT